MQRPTVLVTGGTGTIGSEIVRALCDPPAGVRRGVNNGVSRQWRVVANFARDEERACALQSATGCDMRRADIGDEAQVEALFAGLPPLFAVVHAAGVAHDALLLRQRREEWRETLRVNADGAFLVTRAALRGVEDGGRLILLASRAGERGNAGQGAYAASKAAVIALMRCAAREGAERAIAVNVICPGLVPSALTESLSPERLAELKNQSVQGALGSARQVAATVQWLLGDEASAISGQVIHCDSRI